MEKTGMPKSDTPKMSCKALALGLALGCGLFFAQPQLAEAKLLPADYEEKQAAAAAESGEPQGTAEVPAVLTGESRSITLDEAMGLALANSPKVLSAQNDLASAKVAANKAASQARTVRQTAEIRIPSMPTQTLVYGENGQVSWTTTTTGGGKVMQKDQTYYAATVYGPEATKKAVEIQDFAVKSQESACNLQTIQGYYTVLCDAQSELSAMYALEKARNQQNVVQARLDQGMATRLELLQANTQVNTAQAMLDAAQAKTVQDKRSLNVLMGLAPDTNWTPTTALTFEPMLFTDIEAKVQEMVTESPMVQLTQVVFELAGISRENSMITSPIFTYDGKTAELTYQTAKIEYDNAQRVAYTNAKSMLESLSLAREQYLIYQESQELLEEVYRLAVLQYENGLNTQNDIQAAAADLASNDANRLNALLQYIIAKTAIEQGIVQTS